MTAAVPKTVGRYRLGAKIAAGGMGVVYRARLDAEHGFSREVAVKVMLSEYASDPTMVATFLREARFAGRLRHPNVVAVLEVGVEHGVPWLAMERVDGPSLASLFKRCRKLGTPIPFDVASAIAIGLLEGLEAAHGSLDSEGKPSPIIHRDVSPQNVLIGRDGVVRLIDFGIAKTNGSTQQTEQGIVKGKFGYLAPEQLDGQCDARSDVYAAGAVLWEVVAGRPMLDGETASELFTQLLSRPARLANAYRADAPAGLVEVIDRALQRSPARRFASAAAMAGALEAVASPASPAVVRSWVEASFPRALEESQTPHLSKASLGPGLRPKVLRGLIGVGLGLFAGGALVVTFRLGAAQPALGPLPVGGVPVSAVVAPARAAEASPQVAAWVQAAAPTPSPEAELPNEAAPRETPVPRVEGFRVFRAPVGPKRAAATPEGEVPLQPPPAPEVDCTQTAFVDASGIKRYRPECL